VLPPQDLLARRRIDLCLPDKHSVDRVNIGCDTQRRQNLMLNRCNANMRGQKPPGSMESEVHYAPALGCFN
jgi:hypothetical protein